MKNALTRHWPILAILFINIFFFARLFYPQTKIFVTPDFGLSDLLHFNYPMRKVFAEAIKSHTLPLWETKIGSGLPLFAEGQAGILNIINLISAYFFPLAIGFNLTYLISYLLMGFSTFLFCRLLKLSKISSLLAAIIFSFCGYNITHFAHTHHIVTAAFLPLMFFVLEKSLSRNIRGEQTGRKIWWVILAILASQTLLGGNVQVAAYSFLALGFYFLFRILRSRKGERISTENALGLLMFFTLTFILAFALSAIQLLPSLELSSTSFRRGGLPEQELKQFPYPPKHLLTFLNPYLLGDPHQGTYPRYGEDWGLFWENTGYIGVIPLGLGIFGVVWVFGKKVKGEKKEEGVEETLFWGFLALFSLLLSLGKYTPLFFLLKLPPLNLFRIPSTFLFVASFALAMLAGYGLHAIQEITKPYALRTKTLSSFIIYHFSFFILTFSFLDLFWFGFNYNPIGKVKDWQAEPQVAEFLKKDGSDYRIFDLLSASPWNTLFFDYGWEGNADEYIRFREGLKPDINLIWDIASANSYLGFEPERLSHLKMIIDQTILFHQEKKEIYFTKQAQDLFGIQRVKYFVTPFPILSPNAKLVFQTNYQKGQNYFVYENSKVLPRARVLYDYVSEETIEGVGRMFFSGTLNPESQVVLEAPGALSAPLDFTGGNDASSATASISEESSCFLRIDVKTPAAGILILADTFYPGWIAKVNNQEAEILPANLTQRAVLVPAGSSTVEFFYQPSSFKNGAMITASAWILTVLSTFLLRLFD